MKKQQKKLLADHKYLLFRPDKSGRRSLPKGEGKKALVALSGGIDSAVSAYLLIKQGYEVEGAFMKNWSSTAGLMLQECPWLVDRQDALRVAAFLKIKLHTLDFEKQYRKSVMQYFFKEYKAGRTPNPDVMCNKEIKFKLLYNWARRNGFDYLATGHYARVERRGSYNFQFPISKQIPNSKPQTLKKQNEYRLMRSADEFKDQTYFIYNIKLNQLPHLLFPIGGMKKTAVRSLARKLKLPNADKKESMGLCFVGKIRLKEFLKQKLKPKKGEIVLSSSVSFPTRTGSGKARSSRIRKRESKTLEVDSGYLPSANSGMTDQVIGEHNGLYNFTLGQRQGINVGGTGPYFVYAKDLKYNRLYVTNNPDDDRLMAKEAQIHSVNWISDLALSTKHLALFGRYRHQGDLVPITIKQIKTDLYRVAFKRPQKAVASGQSLVLYKGRECVGGGVIV